jgi:[ribosomal protein S5]-alanine N-acetyltransferase
MAQAPILDTPQLRIIPFSGEHLTPRYVGWLNDPEVVRYSEQRHRVHTLETCRRYFESFTGTPHYFWAVLVKDSPRGHIGNLNAHIDPENRLADVGILIGERTAWRMGYGLEAWRAVCAYLLGEAGMRKVTAGAMAANAAMLQIMRNSGMMEDGRRARHYLLNGGEVDVVHVALFGEPYQAVDKNESELESGC